VPVNSLNGTRALLIDSTVARIEPSSWTLPLTRNGAGPVPMLSDAVNW